MAGPSSPTPNMLFWLVIVVASLHIAASFSFLRTNNDGRRHAFLTPSTTSSSFSSSETALSTWALFSESSSSSFGSSSSSSSATFAMDPTSETARRILRDQLHLSAHQHEQLAKLGVLVNDWNQRINLISRRDCSRDVVFGRHILPSLAPLALLNQQEDGNGDDASSTSASLSLHWNSPGQTVCDVGTGGGFPGLPLAIARPDVEFLLVDSVGKKIAAVQNMADALSLTNVRTFHGRAEELAAASAPSSSGLNEEKEGGGGGGERRRSQDNKFDWVVGRSVAAIPTYCYWIQDLLKKGREGHLVYLIGGGIDEEILEGAVRDKDIESLLDYPGVSDKRVLVFPEPVVRSLALASGEKPGVTPKPISGRASKRKKKSKGEWVKRDATTPKQRGYDNFQRFDSLQQQPYEY